MKRFRIFSAGNSLVRLACLVLSLTLLVALGAPLLGGVAAQVGKLRGGETLPPAQGKLAKNLPELSGISNLKPAQPSAPAPRGIARPCFDCEERGVAGDEFALARLDPRNRTGQPAVDLFSQNINWSKSLIDLDGRSDLDLELSLVYNSLVWTKAGSQVAFDADRGQPSPGFRLGFPVIQPRFRDARTGKLAYLLITPEGSRVELRQTDKTNVYEATDKSLLQLVESATGATLRRPDGSQLKFELSGGQLQSTEIKDRNGNFISASYSKRGHLNTITDTLGRVISFNRDAGGNLLSITHGRGTERRTLATFGYTSVSIQPNFAGLNVVGLAAGSTATLLTQVGLADGTRYQFDYNSVGQVNRITNFAADGHALAYTSYNLADKAGIVLTDAPRPTEMRIWAENANDGAEALTRFSFDAAGAWGQATLPDGSTRKEFFGTDGWQRGLGQRVEERAASGDVQRSTVTEMAQTDEAGIYRVVPRTVETMKLDAKGAQQQTRTEFNASGLPQDIQESIGSNVLRRTHIEYNRDAVYVERHILNLVAEQATTDASGAVVGKTTFVYDMPDSLVDQGAAVQHDAAGYGAGLLTGRGLLTAIRQSNAKNAGQTSETRMGYNTTGSVAFTLTASGQRTEISYADNFADGRNRGTLAFATLAIHFNGTQTHTQYDFATGKTARSQNAQGVVQSFTYDNAGRMVATVNETTRASARRVYAESGTLVATFRKVGPTTKEIGRYNIFDGSKRVRARALDPLSFEMGYRGIYIKRDAVGRPVSRTKPARINSNWEVEGTIEASPVAGNSNGAVGGLQLATAGARQFGQQLLSGLDDLAESISPTAQAQDCYGDYYGGCSDPYSNDWFYGDDWGYDAYWEWTDFADALFWGDDSYFYTDDWDALSYLAGMSDQEFEVWMQFSDSGYLSYATDLEWNDGGYSGTLPLWVVDDLFNNPDFANGILYGFHTDVGRDLADFRGYTGTYGDGSLQIVIDQRTGNFHTDVDRFNPYQDVVNFFGHTFGEVLPNLFRRIF